MNRVDRHGGTAYASERAFGGGYPGGLSGIDSKRRAKRPRNALEAGFGDMMAVGAVNRLDMQRQARVDGERLEELAPQLDVERTDLRRRKWRVKHQERAARDVDRNAG